MQDINILSAYLVSPEVGLDTPTGVALDLVITEIEKSGLKVRTSKGTDGLKKGMYNITMTSDVIVIDWKSDDTVDVIANIRSSDSEIRIFLMTEPNTLNEIPLEVVSEIDEYIWVLGDSPSFIAGRIEAAAKNTGRNCSLRCSRTWWNSRKITNIHGTHRDMPREQHS